MAWSDETNLFDTGEKKSSESSSWAFSTDTSSSEVPSPSESSAPGYSAQPNQNWGDHPRTNWGESPRIDDRQGKTWTIWDRITRWLRN